MREVISIHIGRCGNKIGIKSWEILANEHGLNDEGIYCGETDLEINNIQLYFHETTNRFVPRAIFVDLDPVTPNIVKNSKIGKMFNPNNFVSSDGSAANNFAKGYCTEGPDMLDSVMELIRKETEASDSFQAFQFSYSMGGGTGSGFSSLLCNKIKEEYSDRVQALNVMSPSQDHSDCVTECYNAILCLDQLMSTASFVELMDNQAVSNIIIRECGLKDPSYGDINHLISIISCCTSTNMRFPGKLNTDFRKLSVNLIPYPRFVFLTSSFAPIVKRHCQNTENCSALHNVTMQGLNPRNITLSCDLREGKFIALASLFRGLKYPVCELEDEMVTFQNKNASCFVDWIPSHIKVVSCDIPPRGMKLSMTVLANNTAVQKPFYKLADIFSYLFNRRAFLHCYLIEGLEESEFIMAEENIIDLIDDLQRIADHKIT